MQYDRAAPRRRIIPPQFYFIPSTKNSPEERKADSISTVMSQDSFVHYKTSKRTRHNLGGIEED